MSDEPEPAMDADDVTGRTLTGSTPALPLAATNARTVDLAGWTGPWADDDPDANFKADIATYAPLDPLRTLDRLSGSIGVPVGALVHYVLAKWATEGSAGLLELGPRMARRLSEPITTAETEGTDVARLAAYGELRQIISWLNVPLDRPESYPDPADQ